MNFIGLIPARFASTRFPGKPLALIEGKPMIQWVYERASQVFDNVYVATDDQRIADAVLQFGGKYIMTSDRHRSGTDRCAEALDIAENQTNTKFDIVVNIQGDEPFIQPQQLQKIKNCFFAEKVQIATLVKPFGDGEDIFSPNTPKVVINKLGNAIYFSRSVVPYLRNFSQEEWQRKHIFFKHIGLYAYSADVLREITKLPQSELELAESLEQLRWLENGIPIRVIETDLETLAVDTPEDLERVRAKAKQMLK